MALEGAAGTSAHTHRACFRVSNLANRVGLAGSRSHLGIPVKVNADSGGKPNGIPERR